MDFKMDISQHTDLSIQAKLLFSLVVSMMFSGIIAIVEYYTNLMIENKVYLVLIFSAFVGDIILGAIKHLKTHTFSPRELLTKALIKLVIGFFAMVIFNAMAGIEGMEELGLKFYFTIVGKLLTMVYYSGSAFNSMYIITNEKFPPYSFIKRMKEFNKTLNPKDLVGKQQNV